MSFFFSPFHVIYICKNEKQKDISSEDCYYKNYKAILSIVYRSLDVLSSLIFQEKVLLDIFLIVLEDDCNQT
jgi:hypothetical protein